MTGRISNIIDEIIEERSKGNPAIREMTKAKFILKGLNPDRFSNCSADDPVIMEKLMGIARQLNVSVFRDKEVNIKSAYSTRSSEEDVVLDIKNQLSFCSARVIIFFASSTFDLNRLSNLMQIAFDNCLVIGCSTAGEMVSGKLLNNSVVAMAINSNIISDAKVEVIEHIKESDDVNEAFISFAKYFNESTYTMDVTKYAGIVLIDGVSMKEERIMDLIGNMTNVFFIGGSAGDDSRFVRTHVCANGRSYTDSAILLMLKINDNAEFSIIKTQSFKALNHKFVASKVNEENREVIEFNNRPALSAYSEAVGASSAEDAQKHFMTNPVGLFIGENEMFVRSPQQIKGTSILFYCNILEGMEVRLLESTDIVEDTRKALEDKIGEFGKIDGIIDFDCVERRLTLKKKNQEIQYGEIFKDIPTIGFATYGEEYIGHLNQTATMLVFKSKQI